jgi:hypothetical protein
MNPSPISRMLGSSKALVMLATMAGAFVLVMLGKLTWEQAERFLMVTVPAWMLAVGLEDAGKHFGAAKAAQGAPGHEKPAEPNVEAARAKDETKPD